MGTALALAACGEDVNIPPDIAQSGSRLKLSWWVLEDGTETWTGEIFDSVLGSACLPTEWVDGKWRCTPPTSATVMYTDARCSDPMIYNGTATLALERRSVCGVSRPTRLIESTGEGVALQVAHSRDEQGVCQAMSLPPGLLWLGLRARELPKPVELRRVFHGAGRVRIETLTSSDGLILPVQPYDSELEIACRYTTPAAVIMPCWPEALESDRFADSACETPAVWGLPDLSCPPPAFATLPRMGVCRTYFAVDDTPLDYAYTAAAGGACYEFQVPPSSPAYAASVPLELSVITRMARAGEGRLRLVDVGEGGTTTRVHTLFYDVEFDTLCQLAPDSPGVWTCQPESHARIQTFYGDDQCTQSVPIALVNVNDEGDCIQYQPREYASDGTNYRPIGSVRPEPLYTLVPDVGCVPLVLSNTTPHSMGEPIATPLARATKRRD